MVTPNLPPFGSENITPPGFTQQKPTQFPAEQIPAEIRDRVAWLCDRYQATQAPYTDGKPNAEQRSAARWLRYWRHTISQAERSVMWKLARSGSWIAPQRSTATWRYIRPNVREEMALYRLSEAVTRHFLTADELEAIIGQLEREDPTLPKLGPALLRHVPDILAEDGFHETTRQLFEHSPAHAAAWPGVIQDLVQAVLECRMRAAANGWTLLWPPAEVRRRHGSDRDRARSVTFKQLSIAFADHAPTTL